MGLDRVRLEEYNIHRVRSLQDAIDRINLLSPAQQEEFAAFILEELATEARWQSAMERGRDNLIRLATEALAEHQRGDTRAFDSSRDITHD